MFFSSSLLSLNVCMKFVTQSSWRRASHFLSAIAIKSFGIFFLSKLGQSLYDERLLNCHKCGTFSISLDSSMNPDVKWTYFDDCSSSFLVRNPHTKKQQQQIIKILHLSIISVEANTNVFLIYPNTGWCFSFLTFSTRK